MRACSICGKEITVHVANPHGLYWFSQEYCDTCRATSDPRRTASCSDCGRTVADFVAGGVLGCAQCYLDLGHEIRPLVDAYHKGSGGGSLATARSVPRLALARTREIQEAVLSGRDPGKIESSIRERPAPVAPLRELLTPSRGPGVLKTGTSVPGHGRVRIRVGRNLNGIPYAGRLAPNPKALLGEMLLADGSVLAQWAPGSRGGVVPGQDMAALKKEGLLPETVCRVRTLDAASYLCCGDEDHLRLVQFLDCGDRSELREEIARLARRIEELDEMYAWQQEPAWGWLCACPSNSGAGVRISFEVSLPHLRHSANWPRFRSSIEQAGLEIRGDRGEGSTIGDTVQISNRGMTQGAQLAAEAARILVIVDRAILRDAELRAGA